MCFCTDQEVWLPIAGCEGFYEVSSRGRIRSLDRTVLDSRGHTRRRRGIVLAPSPPDRYGRQNIHLSLPREPGERKNVSTRWVHQLVAEAFLGSRPPGRVVCHDDGDATHNHAQNLRWDGAGSNRLDQQRHGSDWQANKVRCKWGHLLREPNLQLLPSYVERGWRKCLACALAYSTLNKLNKLNKAQRKALFEEESNRRYAAIMASESER